MRTSKINIFFIDGASRAVECGSAFIFCGSVLHNADPDPAAFSMRIRIRLNKICNKLPYEELKKTKKIKLQFQPISLHFFCF